MQYRHTLLYQFSRGGKLLESRCDMFIYRLQFEDGKRAEVTASRDTIILLETLIRYGIVKKITVKS